MLETVTRRIVGLFRPTPVRRVLIVGTGKCGSTALFFRVKKSMPEETVALFEPGDAAPIAAGVKQGQPMLAKLLLPIDPGLQSDLERWFPYRVLLVRDPRDVVVSTVLYTTATQFCWRHSPEAIREGVALLETKEREPGAVSLMSLFGKLWDGFTPEEFSALAGQLAAETDRLSQPPHNYFVFRYEDLVADRLDPLEAYLGFRLVRDDTIDVDFSRVVRTKGTGDWRNWFTKEDEAFFRPLFHASMERFGYDAGDWQISATPHIDAAHCSQYFLRILNERRRHGGLDEVSL